jgi:hypothetical protein
MARLVERAIAREVLAAQDSSGSSPVFRSPAGSPKMVARRKTGMLARAAAGG